MSTVSETYLEAAAFPTHEDAQSAVKAIRDAGVPEEQVSVLYTDLGERVKAGAISGAVWGGVLGGLIGLLFPPVGLLVAAGPIAGVLTSAASMAVTGAVTVGTFSAVANALMQLGMPEDVATELGNHLHKGDALVIAHVNNRELAQQVHTIMEAHNPRAETAPSSGGVVAVSPSSTA
jgi:uncharacterized membrane protein